MPECELLAHMVPGLLLSPAIDAAKLRERFGFQPFHLGQAKMFDTMAGWTERLKGEELLRACQVVVLKQFMVFNRPVCVSSSQI